MNATLVHLIKRNAVWQSLDAPFTDAQYLLRAGIRRRWQLLSPKLTPENPIQINKNLNDAKKTPFGCDIKEVSIIFRLMHSSAISEPPPPPKQRHKMKQLRNIKTITCLSVAFLTMGATQAFAQWSSSTYGNTTYHRGPGGQTGTSSTYGGTTYHNYGGRSGTSSTYGGTTYHSGSLFRGDNNPLFANAEIAQHFPTEAWLDATAERNAEFMLDLAWTLEGLEKRLDQKDEKTTAASLYNATAKLAVGQRNVKLLEQLVRVWEPAKSHLEEAKALGATRGKNSMVPMPRLIHPEFSEDGKLMDLPYGSAYVSSPALVLYQYGDALGWSGASNVAGALNAGRMNYSPTMLTAAAVELKDTNLPEAKQILQEAAELAVEIEDKDGLEYVNSLYSSNSAFTDSEKANYYKEIAASMGATRGGEHWMNSVSPKIMPWNKNTPRSEILKDFNMLIHDPIGAGNLH